jgi:hypothetical protein
MEQKRRSGLGYWGWLALITLVIVIGIVLLYAYRAYSPAV